MDEEDLLLETSSIIDVGNLSELDESAILGDDDVQEERSVKDEAVVHHEETEELDYDEDLEAEKAPRSSKFSSERALMQRRLSQNDARKKEERNRNIVTSSSSVNKLAVEAVKKENPSAVPEVQVPDSTTASSTRAPKVFINPHHKGVIRPQTNLRLPWEAAVGVPSISSLRPPVAVPQQTSVSVMPQTPHSLAFPMVASSSADFTRPPPQIIPLPVYSTPPPSIYPNQYMVDSVGTIPTVGQWDQMVEGFLRRTTVRSRSRFSRSSRSSFTSSRSRSRSYSSHSSSSSVSSRSSSRSPFHRVHSRSRRSSSRRPANYRSRNEMTRRRFGERLRHSNETRREMSRHSDRNRSSVNDAAKQEKTIECAKAIGLDSEYLTKLEEQKKMREEILRKKEERRIQTVQRMGGPILISGGKTARHSERTGNAEERRTERSRRIDDERPRRRELESKDRRRDEIRNGKKELVNVTSNMDSRRNVDRPDVPVSVEKGALTRSVAKKMEPALAVDSGPNQQQVTTRKRENERNSERPRKKKAYLAVVVNSSNDAPISLERIRIIAETVGRTKKVWKSAENMVSLIFEEHECAKKFMFQYHNRVIHGTKLGITLQKLFANLAELP